MSPTDVDQVQLMRSTEAVLPSDGNNTVESEFTVGEGDAEKLEAGQEYVIYVDLEDSDAPLQSAGTLDVFDGAREGATINGGEVDPERPTIEEGQSEETIEVTVDDSDIDFNGADAVTVDIFENGYRVAEGEISEGSEDTVTYEGTYSEQQYVQFHVGVQESQDVAILDTVLVREEVESDDINEFDTNIEITNSDECGIETRTSGQFDCEVDITDEDHVVEFDGSGSTFLDSDDEDITDLTYKWVLGSDEVEEFTQDDIEDEDISHDVIEHTFEEDTTHLVELRVETEIDGETYDSRDTKFVNAVNDTARFESTISDTDITNVDDVSVTILNTKETADEVVDLQYYKDNDGDIYQSDKEDSDKLIDVVEDIRVGADSTTQINNNELDYTDFVADDEVDDLEAGEPIPFEVAIRPADGERYMDEDGGPWVTKDLEFVVPESSIEITEATATVEVCYDGSCEE